MVDEADGLAFGERIREKQSDVLERAFQGLVERGLLDRQIDLEALSEAVRDVGYMLGFMQQVVFGADATLVRKRALAIAEILARGAAPAARPGAAQNLNLPA